MKYPVGTTYLFGDSRRTPDRHLPSRQCGAGWPIVMLDIIATQNPLILIGRHLLAVFLMLKLLVSRVLT